MRLGYLSYEGEICWEHISRDEEIEAYIHTMKLRGTQVTQ